MNITSAVFVKGITGTQEIMYDGKFQVVFMGRSNVGKSTLINSLTKRTNLARSSSHPGKTIRMDFFLINDSFYFVDFPGYGYAKRAPEDRDKLAKMMLWYVQYSEVKDRVVVLVIDAKVGLTELDIEMIATLEEYSVPFLIVANKIDNLKIQERDSNLKAIRDEYKNVEVVPFSSKKKYGRDNLLSKIGSFVKPPKPLKEKPVLPS